MYAKDGMRDIFSREPWRPDCWLQFQFDLVMVYFFWCLNYSDNIGLNFPLILDFQ